MIETNINFQAPNHPQALSDYSCMSKKINIYLSQFSKYEIKDELIIIDCIHFSICHEYIHALIDKVLQRQDYSNKKEVFNEEKIIASMIGFYASDDPYGELYYQDYKKFWKGS